LFKKICESNYFTSDALNFLLIMSLYLSSFFIFHLFSRSGVVDLRWGNLHFNLGACMLNVWACFYKMNLPLKGWHMVVTLAWWNKNLILIQILQQKFPKWWPLCHLQVLSSIYFKKGLPWCKMKVAQTT